MNTKVFIIFPHSHRLKETKTFCFAFYLQFVNRKLLGEILTSEVLKDLNLNMLFTVFLQAREPCKRITNNNKLLNGSSAADAPT
jgi:hypothetical protein